MSIDVSVPGGDANLPGFAVQRPSGRLTISAGQIARDGTMFGVTNDQNGPQVNVFPTPAPGGRRNLCPNPQFGVNVSDFWGFDEHWERQTSPPPAGEGEVTLVGDPPISCFAHFTGWSGTYREWTSSAITLDPAMRDYLCSYYAYRQYEADAFYVWATNQDGDIIGTSYITWLMADFSVMARSLMPVTAGADDVSLTLHVRVYSTTHLAWFTGMMVEPDYGGDILGDFPAYADGDSEGWSWDGTAHNSSSREI